MSVPKLANQIPAAKIGSERSLLCKLILESNMK